MKQLVSTKWLNDNIERVKILDSSWHLPSSKRNAEKEFYNNHIKNSVFFNLDKYSNKNTTLPHMLPSNKDWDNIASNLGIKNTDHIIVYDNSEIFSSCRIWYSFIFFGHDPNLISVLDGDFKKWLDEKRPTTNKIKNIIKTDYKSNEQKLLVVNKDQIEKNIKTQKFQLVDARGEQRFLGLVPEFRKELKSGHIQNSKNIPYTLLINEDRTFKKKEEIINIFKKNKVSIEKDIAFTCGSGVTACILGLANSIITGKKPVIYDGSWAEYGLK